MNRKQHRRRSSGAVNLEGLMPESWCCIDCSINTAPGMPTRATVEQAMKASCLRSDPETMASIRFDDNTEVFIVRDSVWKKAGVEPWGGCLCIGCLERRIGRRLTPKDFRRNQILSTRYRVCRDC
jgi:hypothetical protein